MIKISEDKLRHLRRTLWHLAKKRHGRIVPCGTWERAFTQEGDKLFFWYNTTKDHSTHVISKPVEQVWF